MRESMSQYPRPTLKRTRKPEPPKGTPEHEEWLLELVDREPDLTLEEIQRRLLDERGQKAGLGSVWRFFHRHNISFKKKPARGRTGSA